MPSTVENPDDDKTQTSPMGGADGDVDRTVVGRRSARLCRPRAIAPSTPETCDNGETCNDGTDAEETTAEKNGTTAKKKSTKRKAGADAKKSATKKTKAEAKKAPAKKKKAEDKEAPAKKKKAEAEEASAKKKKKEEAPALVCQGIDKGNFGAILSFAARSMQNTARNLVQWASESDGGIKCYAASALAGSRELLLPYLKMKLYRTPNGYVVVSDKCLGKTAHAKQARCDMCVEQTKKSRHYINKSHHPIFEPASLKTSIMQIARDERKAEHEIRRLRKENSELNKELQDYREVCNCRQLQNQEIINSFNSPAAASLQE